jgi:regulatory protein
VKKPRPPADPDSPKAAFFLALRWLTARELSEGQVRERLTRRGFTGTAVDTAIGRLVANRTIDDRRTASAVARTEARIRRHGPRRILGKLQSIHIDRGLAQEVVRELFGEGDEEQLLENALDKRLRGRFEQLKDPRERQKALAYLMRQGFSASAASQLLRKRTK